MHCHRANIRRSPREVLDGATVHVTPAAAEVVLRRVPSERHRFDVRTRSRRQLRKERFVLGERAVVGIAVLAETVGADVAAPAWIASVLYCPVRTAIGDVGTLATFAVTFSIITHSISMMTDIIFAIFVGVHIR